MRTAGGNFWPVLCGMSMNQFGITWMVSCERAASLKTLPEAQLWVKFAPETGSRSF